MRIIRWTELAADGAFHLGRSPYRRGAGFEPHAHDFAEVFWIAAGPGRCIHATAAGEQLLARGDLVVVRPADRHGFRAEGDGFTLVNLAFPVESLDHLDARYALGLAAGAMRPRRLPAYALDQLGRRVAELAHGPRTRLALERFLLDCAALAEPASTVAVAAGCPPWLQALVQRLAAGDLLDAGVSQLAAAAGCSRGHLARSCADILGCTATELLNRHRMARASALLAIDDASIPAIALACGIGNLGHFYRLFGRTYGCTPRAWRLKARQAG